ncbi:MAG: PAS domain-containing protein, partial [Thermoflexibacteraceae bacterium]
MRGVYTYVNPYFCEFFGLNFNDIIGKSALDSISLEDQSLCTSAVLKAIQQPYQPIKARLRKPLQNGDIVHSQWEFTAITSENGELIEIQAIGFDVEREVDSEKHLAELTNEYESFFHLNMDLLCIVDMNGNFLKVNEAWTRVLDYSLDEIIKHNIKEFIHPEDYATTQQLVFKDLIVQGYLHNNINRYRA